MATAVTKIKHMNVPLITERQVLEWLAQRCAEVRNATGSKVVTVNVNVRTTVPAELTDIPRFTIHAFDGCESETTFTAAFAKMHERCGSPQSLAVEKRRKAQQLLDEAAELESAQLEAVS